MTAAVRSTQPKHSPRPRSITSSHAVCLRFLRSLGSVLNSVGRPLFAFLRDLTHIQQGIARNPFIPIRLHVFYLCARPQAPRALPGAGCPLFPPISSAGSAQ